MLGFKEILLIFLVVVLLFGAKRIPDLAASFGKSIREFKKASAGGDEEGDKKKLDNKDEKKP